MPVDYEVGTIEWFTAYFWPVNPIGSSSGANVSSAHYYAERAIGTMLANGEFLTWEELLKRYVDYFNFTQSMQNGKYTKKEHTLMNIEDYVGKEMFQSDYSKIQENPCDAYLFGLS